MSMDLLGQLAGLDGELEKAPVQDSNQEFPDGNYLWKVEKAELVAVKNGPNAGKPQVEWWLRVIDGPAGTVNRIVFHYHRLYAPDAEKLELVMSRFKTDLARIGHTLSSFKQLPEVLKAIVEGPLLRGALKTGTAGIQNCYFNGVAK